ncbi:MAG: restriction endonuclease subunit S [Rhodocyclales bacterium]|nr:restriction endonuclease subunit S [Rhodocyclales bacterium]
MELIDHLDLLATAPDGIKRLRGLILELAVRGKLVPQDPADEPASELLKRIEVEKARLVREGKIRKAKAVEPVGEDEQPFDLPESWCWARLSEIALLNPRNDANDETEVSFVPMAMIATSFDGKHEQEPRKWKEVKQGFTHFAEGDVGVAKITPCFENSKACVFSGLHSGIGAGTTELHIVRPIPGTLLPRYVLAYFKAPMFLLVGETRMTGTAGQKRLPRDFVELNPFPLPPLPEQHRIVARVDELMALCDRLEAEQTDASEARARLVDALLATLTASRDAAECAANWQRLSTHFDTLFTTEASITALKQTVLQLAVMGRLVPQDPTDEPASELLKRTEAEKARLVKEGRIHKSKAVEAVGEDERPFEVPAGWEWGRFAQVAKVGGRLVDATQFPDRLQVAPDCIEKGTGRLTEKRTVAQAGVRGPNQQFRAGQLLYSKIRPSLSKAVLVDFDGLCSADMYPLDVHIEPRFMLLQILSEVFLNQVRIAENRVKMPKLNQESLNAFLVCIPPLLEQHRIVAKVDELMALCDRLKAYLATARDHRARLADTLVQAALEAA